MIEILYVFLPLAMLCVKDGDRLIAAAFTLPTVAFYWVNLHLPDGIYYIVAAAYDLGIIALLLYLQNKSNTRLVKVLSMLCLASIGIKIIGCAICVTHGNGSVYDAIAIMFYVIVIGIFITWNKLNGALSRYISDAPWLFRSGFLGHKTNY